MSRAPFDFCQKLKMLTLHCVVAIVRIGLGDEVVGVGVGIVFSSVDVYADEGESVVFYMCETNTSSLSEQHDLRLPKPSS
jgi:hypothetical protein